MNRRLKVLASAYACEPGKGSEPGTGWNWVRQIARFHDVWVITRANNRVSIEDELRQRPLPNVHFVYFDLPAWARFWKKGSRGARLYYSLWQASIYRLARRLHQDVNYDIIQHLTIGNYWLPTFLARLPAPFVWGPVGGGESAPRSFWTSFGLRGKVYEASRDLARGWSRLDPFIQRTATQARFTLATTPETEQRVQELGSTRTAVVSKMALSRAEIETLGALPFHQGKVFRSVSVGRLLHWKGFELGLRAFARFRERRPNSEKWYIGDGPERKRLQRLARELGVADNVVFWGSLPREQALQKLSQCDVVMHPSLHEAGGWVCLEAMAAGRPVICLDLGGPGANVSDDTGIRVPALSPQQAVADLAGALQRLHDDPSLRQQMGVQGRQRVQNKFCWDVSGDYLADLYQHILANGQ